ncbi:hypothetical protein J2T14_001294 [Paenibacillus harenae]|nr:hypothetical protein [Paenibacillus harenae]
MRRYNFVRPLILIVIALLTRGLVTNLCMVFGLEQETASSLGFIAMIVGRTYYLYRMMEKRHK